MIVKARTRLLWALMRALAPEQLARVRGTPLHRLLTRGELQTLGGLGVHMLLPAAHFPYWGTQAYGMLSGLHEPMVQEAIRRSLPPGGVFVDVGCNIGTAALIAARIAGPAGRVIAIDAQAESAQAVRAAVAANALGNVEVHQAAVGESTGTAEVIVTADALWTRVAQVGDHELEIRRDVVDAITIDSLGLQRLDAIKIDVEGAELDVIAGMAQTLARCRPVVICEMHGKNARYVELLATHGYAVENLERPEPVALAHGNVQTLARPAA